MKIKIDQSLKTEEFAYFLPPELIAQDPIQQRDSSRLLVLAKDSGKIKDSTFKELPGFLKAGDLLVLNDTRVLPARLLGHRKDTGGRVELLLLRHLPENKWEVLCSPGKRVRPGTTLTFGNGLLEAEVLEKTAAGGRTVIFKMQQPWEDVLHKLSRVPLPPYIKKPLKDRKRYQTVYAHKEGSSAAPTAGLHFTDAIFAKLKKKGINWAYLTMHIGLGTFRPVKTEYIKDHVMHSEYFEIPAATARAINMAREKGGRIIAVGTSCCRVLESQSNPQGKIGAGSGETNLFIYPGYNFKLTDILLTNFHLPRSTLLMLVSAFAGRENILSAYEKAVEMKYRFYSFGDAMLII